MKYFENVLEFIKEAIRFLSSSTVNEFLMQIVSGAVSGAVGGFIVLQLERRYAERKERQEKSLNKVVKSTNLDKIVTDSIFWELRPGTNIELMRELLGVPTKRLNVDSPVFGEEIKKTNSYIYTLNNSHIKITSEDNETINSITVFPYDDSFEIDNFIMPSCTNGCQINLVEVDESLLEVAINHKYISSRIDSSFAIQHFIPHPLYQTFTLFGTPPRSYYENREENNINSFLGGVISGICISDSSDSAYFIYEMETR